MENEFEKLEELCKPLQVYLDSHYNPHTEIVVSFDGIEVKNTIMGMPSKSDQSGD